MRKLTPLERAAEACAYYLATPNSTPVYGQKNIYGDCAAKVLQAAFDKNELVDLLVTHMPDWDDGREFSSGRCACGAEIPESLYGTQWMDWRDGWHPRHLAEAIRAHVLGGAE